LKDVTQVFRDAKFNFSIGKATAHSQLFWAVEVTVQGNSCCSHATAKLHFTNGNLNNRQNSPTRPELPGIESGGEQLAANFQCCVGFGDAPDSEGSAAATVIAVVERYIGLGGVGCQSLSSKKPSRRFFLPNIYVSH
jgi:hypothetical protein